MERSAWHEWSVAQVCAWLQSQGHSADIVQIFQANRVDGAILSRQTNTSLRDELRILNIADRQQILADISKLWASEYTSTERLHSYDSYQNISNHHTIPILSQWSAGRESNRSVASYAVESDFHRYARGITLKVTPKRIELSRAPFPLMRPILFAVIAISLLVSLAFMILSMTIDVLRERSYFGYVSIVLAVICAVLVYGWDGFSQKMNYKITAEELVMEGSSFFFPNGRVIPVSAIESICTRTDKPQYTYLQHSYVRMGVYALIVLKPNQNPRGSRWLDATEVFLPLPFSDVEQVYAVCERISRIMLVPFVPSDSFDTPSIPSVRSNVTYV
eukprot:TRINITY_DN12138_c1_g1_i1.p1 TRINITY_DN12138_c1_g1~~TRINITY_DN12138_c1_g1_i1.p1  ORF type:complete len:332 (+),score=63.99 TRINITY_DN12138_c1_g1_i1:18-1013(+)